MRSSAPNHEPACLGRASLVGVFALLLAEAGRRDTEQFVDDSANVAAAAASELYHGDTKGYSLQRSAVVGSERSKVLRDSDGSQARQTFGTASLAHVIVDPDTQLPPHRARSSSSQAPWKVPRQIMVDASPVQLHYRCLADRHGWANHGTHVSEPDTGIRAQADRSEHPPPTTTSPTVGIVGWRGFPHSYAVVAEGLMAGLHALYGFDGSWSADPGRVMIPFIDAPVYKRGWKRSQPDAEVTPADATLQQPSAHNRHPNRHPAATGSATESVAAIRKRLR